MEDDILLKRQMFKLPVKDNNSPLIGLKETNPDFIFGPSFCEDHTYQARTDVVKKLTRINQSLLSENKVLIIHSAWRSFAHQKELFIHQCTFLRTLHPEKTIAQIDIMVSHFIAPENRSMHATGGAVDALIYDMESRKVLDFGTNNGYDIDLGVMCYPYHPEISAEAQKNRDLLIRVFEQEDFVVDLKKFWHFNYGNSAWAAAKNLDYAIYGPIFN